jgi:hypothetical protein
MAKSDGTKIYEKILPLDGRAAVYLANAARALGKIDANFDQLCWHIMVGDIERAYVWKLKKSCREMLQALTSYEFSHDVQLKKEQAKEAAKEAGPKAVA